MQLPSVQTASFQSIRPPIRCASAQPTATGAMAAPKVFGRDAAIQSNKAFMFKNPTNAAG
jgi:hypothetical protein